MAKYEVTTTLRVEANFRVEASSKKQAEKIINELISVEVELYDLIGKHKFEGQGCHLSNLDITDVYKD